MYITPENSITLSAPFYNRSERRMWQVGEYECWVVALANQQYISSSEHTRFTVSPILTFDGSLGSTLICAISSLCAS